ncbi:13845_t:CDS:2, partial [Entrophospora sp. SA101]
LSYLSKLMNKYSYILQNLEKTFFGAFICCFLWNYLWGSASRPVVIELREKWQDKTGDDAIKDVDDCCGQIFCSRPESYLCKYDDKFRRYTVDFIQNNECLGLYKPDDDHFLYLKSRNDLCKVLQHFQTPLTRCFYSNIYLCDSFTGYFKRDTEDRVLAMIGLATWYSGWDVSYAFSFFSGSKSKK